MRYKIQKLNLLDKYPYWQNMENIDDFDDMIVCNRKMNELVSEHYAEHKENFYLHYRFIEIESDNNQNLENKKEY